MEQIKGQRSSLPVTGNTDDNQWVTGLVLSKGRSQTAQIMTMWEK